jgi:hypothetical protein
VENYSLLIMGVSNDDEDGGGVDRDGSRGNSLSWQGAETETSVPQNWSSMAAVLWNFSWIEVGRFRVFASERIYRRNGDVRGWTVTTQDFVKFWEKNSLLYCLK